MTNQKKNKNRPFFISFLILITYLIGNSMLLLAGLIHWFFGDKAKKK